MLKFQLEGEKNKLENLLHNNLMKKRDRIANELQEVSAEDRRQKLDQYQTELESEDNKVTDMKKTLKGPLSVVYIYSKTLWMNS